MFGIFVHYSTRPIYDVSMNLVCWPPSVDIFNILPGFLWQPLLTNCHRSITKAELAVYLFIFSEWFAQQAEFTTEFESMEVTEMNNCFSKFYLWARKQDGRHYKKTSPLSIRAALDRYLRSLPINKKFSICDTIQFNEANKALNSYLKHLASTGKIAGTVHKNPLIAEVVQKLF